MKSFEATELPALFNEWMRRFTEEPHRFKAEFQECGLFLAEQAAGKPPSYGDHCTGYLDRMRNDRAPVSPSPTRGAKKVRKIKSR